MIRDRNLPLQVRIDISTAMRKLIWWLIFHNKRNNQTQVYLIFEMTSSFAEMRTLDYAIALLYS